VRKWLAIFLLVFMPLQLGWAAVASYCQHETGAAAQHTGHHDHQHKAVDGKAASPDPAKAALGSDPDCAFCHAGCASAVLSDVAVAAPADAAQNTSDHRAHLTWPPSERLERPQWRALA